MSVTEISKAGSGASFTQKTASALTTVITPKADCTAASAYEPTTWAGNQWAYQLDSGISKETCYPSSYSDYQYNSGLWYSPGVCPLSYEYVATSIQSSASGPATTLAVCCPPGIHTAPESGWSCLQVITSVDTDLSFANTLSTTLPATTAFANPISVAWQESDLPLFTPASAPLLALAAQGITFPPASASSSLTSSTTSSSSSSSTSAASGSSSLSTGAAAGIGVGVTVCLFALILGVWWFVRHFQVMRRNNSSPQEGAGVAREKTENLHHGNPYAVNQHPVEAPDTTLRYEVDGRNPRSELDGGWQGHGELRGDVRG
ncbi:hypothetical protein F5Y15DRAFT_291964 [Xylariaceae sp. FL0016]|nr:hypothetical protein F5Y15DRAFT_291964 [Xylariaceae sp. FL0016]